MDSRWRFLHHLCGEAVTQKDSAYRVMVNSVGKRGCVIVKYVTLKAERSLERSQVGKRAISRWREKLLGDHKCPYRKPTQVGEERILRRTGEPLLRNSAK